MSVMQQSDFPASPFPGATFVPGVGNPRAQIMVIGEAPGATEDEQGLPFVGGAGKILDMAIKQAGLSRADMYVTNVLKYRPPNNNIKHPKAQLAMKGFKQALLAEIFRVKPNVIVPLGNTALSALGIGYPITRARGSIFSTSLGKVIPTYHPAYIMRQWHEMFTSIRDWSKIKRHMSNRVVREPIENFIIDPTLQDLELLELRIQKQLQKGTDVVLGVDLETFYVDHPLDTPIKTIGIATSSTNAIVVPFITQAGNYYWNSDEEATRAIDIINRLLSDPRITIMCHNALFDVQVLMHHGFEVTNPIYDTMLGQYLVYHPSPHTLEYLVSIYSDYPAWKLEAGDNDKEFREYNARDCVVMHAFKEQLDEDIISNNVHHVFENVCKVILPTCRMMLNGIGLDNTKYNATRDMLTSDMGELKSKLVELSGRPSLNPSAPQQVGKVLFDDMGLVSGVKTGKGKKSTGKDVLNKLANRYPDNEFVSNLLLYREYEQRYKTFIKNLRTHDDGRVHTQFALHTAVTGRYSSKNPNLQNLPARTDPQGYIRQMYRAAPGNVIVEFDYSQQELMIFAELAGDEIWKEAFSKGEDVHALNAVALIGFYNKKYRTFVKNFIYGLIYGSEGGEIEKVAPRELLEKLSIRQMLNNLQKEHPWLFEYRKKIEKDVNKNHYVLNAYGRKRWFVGKPTKADLRAAYNFPIQSTAADIVHEKTPQIDELMLDNEGCKLILQLHDAYYLEMPEADVPRVAPIVKSIMEERVVTPLGYEFNLKVEGEKGPSLSSVEMEPLDAN